MKFLMKGRLALRKTVTIDRIAAIRAQEIVQMFNRGQADRPVVLVPAKNTA